MFELQEMLKAVTGMQGVSLTPMAGAQGEFAGFGAKRLTGYANDVADIDFPEDVKKFFAQLVFGDINLNAPRAILHLHKSRFSKIAFCHNAAGHTVMEIQFVQVGLVMIGMGLVNLAIDMRDHEIIGKWVDLKIAQLLKLRSTLGKYFVWMR